MFLLNGNTLRLDTAFEHDGILYPENWLRLTSLEEKQAIGIIEVPDPVQLDTRYYNDDGSQKDLAEITQKQIAAFRSVANDLLSPTDWYVIRKIERGVDIPADIATLRQAILTECDRLIAECESSQTLEQHINVISSQNWPRLNQ